MNVFTQHVHMQTTYAQIMHTHTRTKKVQITSRLPCTFLCSYSAVYGFAKLCQGTLPSKHLPASVHTHKYSQQFSRHPLGVPGPVWALYRCLNPETLEPRAMKQCSVLVNSRSDKRENRKKKESGRGGGGQRQRQRQRGTQGEGGVESASVLSLSHRDPAVDAIDHAWWGVTVRVMAQRLMQRH